MDGKGTESLPVAEVSKSVPLVSVVITCYNHAHYLGVAIESALAQTWRPLEIIVIDDGSTDGTSAVIDRYPGITGLRQTNQGLSAARNAGLRVSRGRFVLFLDADDLLLPKAVESSVGEILAHPDAALVSAAFRYVDEHGNPKGGVVFRPVNEDHYLALLKRNYIAMHATVLYRREILEGIGGFDISLRACEDYDVYLKIARQFPIRQFPELVALYRRHGDNMSGDPERMMIASHTVHSRQLGYLGSDRRRRRAYRAGVRRWGDLYGFSLLFRSFQNILRGELNRSIRGMALVFRYSPWTVIRSPAKLFARRMLDSLPPRMSGAILARLRFDARRTVGKVRFGSLRRLTPISTLFGFERGLPIDRYYIENFLGRHADNVRGRVLEIGDDTYTKRFGGTRVAHSDVLNVRAGNPASTFVGDLATANHLPTEAFDCIIITQTLQWIYDLRGALSTLERILKPSGVILATVPGVSKIDQYDGSLEWFWSFTPSSAKRLFDEYFPDSAVTVETHGNVLAAACFLYGLAAEELRRNELDYSDPSFPVVVTIRVLKK